MVAFELIAPFAVWRLFPVTWSIVRKTVACGASVIVGSFASIIFFVILLSLIDPADQLAMRSSLLN